jgi:hypothetical protein
MDDLNLSISAKANFHFQLLSLSANGKQYSGGAGNTLMID